jgi:DNA-binding transcriptional LysR family regulator
MQDMDWDDLRYFLTVARAGSLAGAARALSVNHSTVLRRLGGLEKRLNARLFDRFQTGYVMTEAGEALQKQLGGVAEQIDSAQRQLAGLDTALSGTIRITSTDTLVSGLLTPSLAEFRRRHPGIHLQVTINNSFLNLTQREADVAVRPAVKAPENLVGRPVGAVQTAVYASETYLRELAERGIEPTDWTKHDWVAPDEGLSHLAQARWVSNNVPGERVVLRVDSLVAMFDAVRHGAGMGMLLCFLADGESNLVRVAAPDPALDTPVWVLTHPDLRRVHRIKALTDHLFDALSTHPLVVPLPVRARRSDAVTR